MINPLDRARQLCAEAQAPVIMTGAGASSESGVPTFRGDGGLWREFRAMDLATPEAFERDPDLVWEWYGWRREKIASVEPNPGHLALAHYEQAVVDRGGTFCLVTQNVDDLHERAGTKAPLHLHGSLWRVRCVLCHHEYVDKTLPSPRPRQCVTCRGALRPAVVWFGESLDRGVISDAFSRARQCDVFVVIGTSGVVQPAASLASVASEEEAAVIEVNPDETPLSALATVSLRGPSATLLPQFLKA